MGSRWISVITSCLLVLSGCGTSRTTVRPEIYGQFEKTGPIILDTVTGLEWQVGPNRDMTWDEAKAWVDSLSGTWRMPTRGELRGLWNVNIRHRNWGPFENDRLWVWSGAVRDSSSVWAIGFRTGSQYCADRSSFSSNVLAFAVRSLSETPVSYEQFEKAGPIIRDTVTGLEWQVGPDRDMNWYEAREWVFSLGTTWWMPNVGELQSLWESGINVRGKEGWGPFENSGWAVWSGEVQDSSSAWGFFFYDDGRMASGYFDYSDRMRAFAVRYPDRASRRP